MSLKVLDLFSGCGGLSLGFKLAGFKIEGAIDHDPDSIETFRKNFGFFVKDINKLNKEFIKKNYKNIDVIIGGPPCQVFLMQIDGIKIIVIPIVFKIH